MKLCLQEDLKEGFRLHFTLIFIQFQSRTYPRNLLTQFQHYDKESGGKRLFNFKLAIILPSSSWNWHKQVTRAHSLMEHLAACKYPKQICPFVVTGFVLDIYSNLYTGLSFIPNNSPTSNSFSHLLIPSFNKYLSSTLSAPGTVLGTGLTSLTRWSHPYFQGLTLAHLGVTDDQQVSK